LCQSRCFAVCSLLELVLAVIFILGIARLVNLPRDIGSELVIVVAATVANNSIYQGSCALPPRGSVCGSAWGEGIEAHCFGGRCKDGYNV
jgi:hypothetical protein